jgi:sRNA-binding protein
VERAPRAPYEKARFKFGGLKVSWRYLEALRRGAPAVDVGGVECGAWHVGGLVEAAAGVVCRRKGRVKERDPPA